MQNKFIFIVLVVAIFSSFSKKQTPVYGFQIQTKEQITLDSNKWRLTKIYDTDSAVQVPETKAFIHFNIAGEKVNGNGSCNSFGGKIILDGNNLRFATFFSTKMYCTGVQSIEDEFFRQLQRVTRYEIKGKKLILFNGDNAVLEFEAG